jgi:hypothetical protein
MGSRLILAALLVGLVARPYAGPEQLLSFLPVGIFIASIEEGARIFTPVRLLPLEHPEALGHQFPNALQLRGSEFDAIVLVARHTGLELSATLQRYPQQPDPTWSYQGFEQPPIEALRKAAVVRRAKSEVPLPGLRAVGFYRRQCVVFVVDTRGLSLAERGMERPTTMGLDVSRAVFLEAVRKAAVGLSASADATIVVYDSK